MAITVQIDAKNQSKPVQLAGTQIQKSICESSVIVIDPREGKLATDDANLTTFELCLGSLDSMVTCCLWISIVVFTVGLGYYIVAGYVCGQSAN